MKDKVEYQWVKSKVERVCWACGQKFLVYPGSRQGRCPTCEWEEIYDVGHREPVQKKE